MLYGAGVGVTGLLAGMLGVANEIGPLIWRCCGLYGAVPLDTTVATVGGVVPVGAVPLGIAVATAGATWVPMFQ